MYSFSGRVRYSECDEDCRLTLLSAINYMQDCSTFQSEASNVGLEWLREHDRAWLLSAWKITIERMPSFGETVTVATSPNDFRGSLGWRSFTIFGEDQKPAVTAQSLWVYVQVSAQRPVRILPEDRDPYGAWDLDNGKLVERKIPLPEIMESQEPFAVRKDHLDSNHHVNNGQYIAMAMPYLPETFDLHTVTADYRRQAHLGDLIVPKVAYEEHMVTVALTDGSDVYAAVRFTD